MPIQIWGEPKRLEAQRFYHDLKAYVEAGNFPPNVFQSVGLPLAENHPDFTKALLNKIIQAVQKCGEAPATTVEQLVALKAFLSKRANEISVNYGIAQDDEDLW